MAIENTTFHIRAEQKIGIFYVFFSIWRNFFFFFFVLNIWMNYRNATANTNFFLWRENREYCERKIVFLLYLGTKYASFFHLFFSSIWRDTTRRFDDFFFRRISAWIHEATGSSYFGAKNWTSFSQIKHHNWPPIFLLEEQGIVPRSEPMLLPQPGLWNREESCGTYPSSLVLGFAKRRWHRKRRWSHWRRLGD